jgi:hypothetical protein
VVGRYGTHYAIRYDDGDFEMAVDADLIASAVAFELGSDSPLLLRYLLSFYYYYFFCGWFCL